MYTSWYNPSILKVQQAYIFTEWVSDLLIAAGFNVYINFEHLGSGTDENKCFLPFEKSQFYFI